MLAFWGEHGPRLISSRVCARALDYCPPVDITFGDSLAGRLSRRTMTWDPTDPEGIRDAFMQAFPPARHCRRQRQIHFRGCAPLGHCPAGRPQADQQSRVRRPQRPDEGREGRTNGRILRAYVRANGKKLGFDMSEGGKDIEIPSFHPTFRIGSDGRLHVDMVIEAVQTRYAALDEDNDALGTFPMRGGVTLLVAQQPPRDDGTRPDPEIRYVVHIISAPSANSASE